MMLPLQVRDRMLRGEKDTFDINGLDLVPLFLGDLVRGFVRTCDAGVVDENVNTPKSLRNVGKHRSHFRFVRDIQMPIFPDTPFTGDLFRNIFALRIAHIRDCYRCSFLC